jgi:hypothetical protein
MTALWRHCQEIDAFFPYDACANSGFRGNSDCQEATMQNTQFSFDGGVLDGYGVLLIDGTSCPAALAEDLRGIAAARWLAAALRHDFETACYGAGVCGSLGTFDGVSSDTMPGHWRRTELLSAGVPVWVPDARHPLGKWLADAAARLLPVPPPEVLDGVLRRHGIEGSREPAPQMAETEGGWAVLIHKPKAAAGKVPGVRRRDALLSLWSGGPVP